MTQFALALTEDFTEPYKAYCIILDAQISKASKLLEQNFAEKPVVLLLNAFCWLIESLYFLASKGF